MEPVSLHRRVDLDVPVTELWELIADPANLASWLGDGVELDVEPGGTGSVVDGDVRRFVHVDRVDHRRSLAFTWWEHDDPATRSTVAFEIVALPDGGSRLEITETLAAGASTLAAAERAAQWEVRVCSLWACTVVAALVP